MNKKTIISCSLIVVCVLICLKGVNANDKGHPNRLTTPACFSDLPSRIDERKFSALCQFWINKAETEYGFKIKELATFILHSEKMIQAIFRFDKIQLSCVYSISPKYGAGDEHETSIGFIFYQKKDYDEFLRSKPFAGMKKKTKIKYYDISNSINIDNYPAEEQDDFKRIYFGYAGPVSFNVKAALDSVTQLALRQPAPGENMLAFYRDKGNRFLSGEGVVKNYEIAGDFYQKAWLLGDDTSGLFLGFLFLEYGLPEKNKLYNPALGRAYFDSVCQSGSPIGNYGIGWMYQIGYNGFPKDIVKAISFYEKGAAKGDLCCISALNYVYNNEYGYINRQKAKEYFEQMMYLNPGSKRTKCRPGIF